MNQNLLSRPRRFCSVVTYCIYGCLAVLAAFSFQQSRATTTAGSSAKPAATLEQTNAPITKPTQAAGVSNHLSPAFLAADVELHPKEILVQSFDTRLATARYLEMKRQPEKAEPILKSLLADTVPDPIRKKALFELANAVSMENDLPRAEAIYAQYLTRWPDDPRTPEILLREGQLFRQMGLDKFALTKFYSVMTSALSLKSNQLHYYQHLVLQAQMEIAETHYLMGQYGDAADFYLRLLKQDAPALNREQVQFRLIRSLVAIGENNKAVGQARDFLSRYPDAPDEAEVRFYLAQAFKHMGRNNEALRQVLLLLQEEKVKTKNHPELWAYWQQRAGNEIANQLYREGDYVKALDVYMSLAKLDPKPSWQIPVEYQIGMTYEQLMQPQKAIQTYKTILQREPELGTNVSPSLQSVCDMAKWRINFLKWQNTAEQQNRALAMSLKTETNSFSDIQ